MHIQIRRFIFIATALFSVSGCWKNDLKEYYGREGMWTPRPFNMGKLPQGDDSYSQGVRDGCNTAMPIVGSGMLNSTYDDSYYDVQRGIDDKDYYKGYTLGFNYCTYYLDVDPL